jgi:hypothetical protein
MLYGKLSCLVVFGMAALSSVMAVTYPSLNLPYSFALTGDVYEIDMSGNTISAIPFAKS